MAECLLALQITRNTRRIYEWQDLREQLAVVHTVMIALGEPPAKVKIIVDAVARGKRLTHAAGVTGKMILDMFTNLLPRAHGVANELFSADVARIRKENGGGMGQGFVVGGLSVPYATRPPGPMGFPTITTATGNLAAALPMPFAAAAAAAQYPPAQATQPRGRGRRSRAPEVVLPLAQAAGTGHYTPAPAGGGGPAAAIPAGMTAGQYQAVVDARSRQNEAMRQQQLARPGQPNSGEFCRKCDTADRNPNHGHLTCAFWTCGVCKEAGHRRSACTKPFAP